MKRRLLGIFAPVVLAAVLVVGVLLAPLPQGHLSKATVQKGAVSMAPTVLLGDQVKSQALSQNYVPFYGSSELSRMDPLHPSVLAAKYQRPYKPFLFGAPGTQSLTHFVNDQTMLNQLRGKKVVVILSIQWFTKMGQRSDAFAYYYSPLQLITWIRRADPKSVADRYAAKRLLTMSAIKNSDTVRPAIKKIAAGKEPSQSDQDAMALHAKMLSNEDNLFARFSLKNNYRRIEKAEKKLPAQDNVQKLDAVATKIGRRDTTNNQMGIDNSFYSMRLANGKLRALKDSQTHFDYRRSPEYGDLELLLNQFAQYHIKAQFILPPVNQKWARYTGLSEPMVQASADKIKQQLTSQGFNRVLDMIQDGSRPYFMQDTIHVGWRGWVKIDSAVKPFLEDSQPNPQYHINPHYFSKAWANQIVR